MRVYDVFKCLFAGILKHPNEYDDSIPAGSISEFVLGHAEKYGEDAACVCFSLLTSFLVRG